MYYICLVCSPHLREDVTSTGCGSWEDTTMKHTYPVFPSSVGSGCKARLQEMCFPLHGFQEISGDVTICQGSSLTVGHDPTQLTRQVSPPFCEDRSAPSPDLCHPSFILGTAPSPETMFDPALPTHKIQPKDSCHSSISIWPLPPVSGESQQLDPLPCPDQLLRKRKVT